MKERIIERTPNLDLLRRLNSADEGIRQEALHYASDLSMRQLLELVRTLREFLNPLYAVQTHPRKQRIFKLTAAVVFPFYLLLSAALWVMRRASGDRLHRNPQAALNGLCTLIENCTDPAALNTLLNNGVAGTGVVVIMPDVNASAARRIDQDLETLDTEGFERLDESARNTFRNISAHVHNQSKRPFYVLRAIAQFSVPEPRWRDRECVKGVADCVPTTAYAREISEAARNALRTMDERAEELRLRQSLLRASSAPQVGEALLRPASHPGSVTEKEELLRASE